MKTMTSNNHPMRERTCHLFTLWDHFLRSEGSPHPHVFLLLFDDPKTATRSENDPNTHTQLCYDHTSSCIHSSSFQDIWDFHPKNISKKQPDDLKTAVL